MAQSEGEKYQRHERNCLVKKQFKNGKIRITNYKMTKLYFFSRRLIENHHGLCFCNSGLLIDTY